MSCSQISKQKDRTWMFLVFPFACGLAFMVWTWQKANHDAGVFSSPGLDYIFTLVYCHLITFMIGITMGICGEFVFLLILYLVADVLLTVTDRVRKLIS